MKGQRAVEILDDNSIGLSLRSALVREREVDGVSLGRPKGDGVGDGAMDELDEPRRPGGGAQSERDDRDFDIEADIVFVGGHDF